MSNRVLKCDYDILAGLDGYEDKIDAIRKHIETMHLSISETGVSYVGVLDKGEGHIRLVSASTMEKLLKYVQDTEEGEGYIRVSVMTVNTKQ